MTVTMCEHCIHAIRYGDEQVGCKFNLLDKFDKTMVGNSYQLNGLCRHMRNCYSEAAQSPDPVEFTRKQCEITYGVVCAYDGDREKLDITMNSFSGSYKPYDFVIAIGPDLDVDIMSLYRELNDKFPHTYIVQEFSDESIAKLFIKAVAKTNADFIYFTDCGEKVDKKFIEFLNSSINQELKRVYLIASPNFTCCYRELFKKYTRLANPIECIYKDLLSNDKTKDTVIKWPLQ